MHKLITAVITPFNDDLTVDYNQFRQLLEDQIASGIIDFVINGTTAEAPTLAPSEKRQLLEIAIELLPVDGSIIVGISSNSTSQMLESIKAIDDLVFDTYMVCPPYYNKTSQEGLYKHVMAITAVTDKQILLYNVPSRCQMSFELETVTGLSQEQQVIGIKEASGDLNYFYQVVTQTNADFKVYNGNDDLITVTAKLGANGVISAISNSIPSEVEKLNQLLATDSTSAETYFQKLLPLINKTYEQVNPIGVKALGTICSECSDNLRLPLVKANGQYYQELKAVYDACK